MKFKILVEIPSQHGNHAQTSEPCQPSLQLDSAALGQAGMSDTVRTVVGDANQSVTCSSEAAILQSDQYLT